MKRKLLNPVFLLTGLVAFCIGGVAQSQDLNTAISLTRSEQYDEASKKFKELIQKEPGNSRNYYYYGENYLLEYFSDTISNSWLLPQRKPETFITKGSVQTQMTL